jgi:hypothetical protein
VRRVLTMGFPFSGEPSLTWCLDLGSHYIVGAFSVVVNDVIPPGT